MKKLLMIGTALLTLGTGLAFVPGHEKERLASEDFGAADRKVERQEKSAVAAEKREPRRVKHRAGEAPLYLYGNMIYNGKIRDRSKLGIYRYVVNSDKPQREPVFLDQRLYANDGGSLWSRDGYYATRGEGAGIYMHVVPAYVWRTSDWSLVKEDPKLEQYNKNYFYQGGWDYTRNRLYVPFDNDSTLLGIHSGYMDLPDLTAKFPYPKRNIYDENAVLYAAAVDMDGYVYYVSRSGDLRCLYVPTSNRRLIGSLGLGEMMHRGGMIVDPLTRNLYYFAFCKDESLNGLYLIDKETAEAKLVWKSPDGERVNGLFFKDRELALPKAPAQVEDLKWTANSNGSLDGKIEFTIPTKCYDGSAAGGEMEYEVAIDKVRKILTGKGQAGSKVILDYKFGTHNFHNIRVSVKNAAGESPWSVVDRYMGLDDPKEVDKPLVRLENGKVKLTWTKPTTSAHGGDWGKDNMTYSVVRVPGNDTVVSNKNVTSYEEAGVTDRLKGVCFRVNARGNGKGNTWGTSDTLVMGKIKLPYVSNLDDVDEVYSWRIFNNNNSEKTWYWNKSMKCFIVSYDRKDMDDWLISPPIPMEKGKVYKMTYLLSGYDASRVERMEIKAGQGQTVKDMTLTVRDTFEFLSKREAPVRYIEYVRPTNTGDWNVAFHGCSRYAMYHVYLKDIRIAEGVSSKAPTKVTDAEFVSSESGKPEGYLQFKAPATNFDGEKLTGTVDIAIYKNDTLMTTLKGLTPGTVQKVNDKSAARGLSKYTFIPSNKEGEGEEFSDSFFVGTAVPDVVTNLRAAETKPGYVKLSWDAPVKDKDGNKFNPNMAMYKVTDVDNKIIYADSLKGTSVEFKVCEATDEATWANFRVKTFSVAGVSAKNVTHTKISVGKPLTMPFKEPFSNGETKQNWLRMTYGNVNAAPLVDGQATAAEIPVYSQNGDNGYYGFNGQGAGYMLRMLSLKISVTGKNPTLSLWVYKYPGADNPLDFMVNEEGSSDGWKSMKTISQAASQNGWVREEVSLKNYIGKTIQIGWMQTTKYTSLGMVDNLSADEKYARDLSAGRFGLDKSLTADSTYKATIPVTNIGTDKSGAFDLKIYRNEILSETQHGIALEPGAEKVFIWTMKTSNGLPKDNYFKAEVVYDADENKDNNTTAVLNATLDVPDLARIFNLTGERNRNDVNLSWSPADLNIAAKDTTDNLESLKAFSIGSKDSEVEGDNLGGWISVDKDGKKNLALVTGNTEYKFPNAEKACGFMVWNWEGAKLNKTPWKGNNKSAQAFISLGVDGKKDDWLISPELPGVPFDFLFMARTPDKAKGLENIEIWISKGSTDPKDFEFLTSASDVPTAWGRLSLELPYGTKRVAIRAVTDGGIALLIDDITFAKLDTRYKSLNVKGYNVYRNGEKLTSTPLGAPGYTDKTSVGSIDNAYGVTTVFDKGESGASNIWIAKAGVGVDSMTADGGVSVTTTGRMIIVRQTDPKGLSIYRADGSLAVMKQPHDYCETEMDDTGVYLVKVGEKTFKVMVK